MSMTSQELKALLCFLFLLLLIRFHEIIKNFQAPYTEAQSLNVGEGLVFSLNILLASLCTCHISFFPTYFVQLLMREEDGAQLVERMCWGCESNALQLNIYFSLVPLHG